MRGGGVHLQVLQQLVLGLGGERSGAGGSGRRRRRTSNPWCAPLLGGGGPPASLVAVGPLTPQGRTARRQKDTRTCPTLGACASTSVGRASSSGSTPDLPCFGCGPSNDKGLRLRSYPADDGSGRRVVHALARARQRPRLPQRRHHRHRARLPQRRGRDAGGRAPGLAAAAWRGAVVRHRRARRALPAPGTRCAPRSCCAPSSSRRARTQMTAEVELVPRRQGARRGQRALEALAPAH